MVLFSINSYFKGIKHIEKTVKFAHDPRLGYLTFCPSNLGTTCRASVHIKIPKVSALKEFKAIVDSLGLQLRGNTHTFKYVLNSNSNISIVDSNYTPINKLKNNNKLKIYRTFK